ncbi:amidase [Rhodovulum sp. YEN HP10]|uniref:amidase n=1 Tax=Rhodovulum sp. HP10 TaxID=3387397 RepID=UPI0039E02862
MTSQDSPSVAPYRAEVDNPVVARLKREGAIVLGKTTMSEFAWSGISRNPVTGITHNPWGRGLNAGASSAGAAAAAAAGFGALHLGSDGAGSIRLPAHFCGVFGIKPTYGRVPQVPVSNNDYATHVGPITRSVRDGALMLDVMTGAHALDRTSLEGGPTDHASALALTDDPGPVAFSPDLGHARVDPDVGEVVLSAVERLRSELGWTVRDVAPDWGPEGPEIGRFFWAALQSKFLPEIERFGDDMSPDLVACAREGAHYSVSEYHQMREWKNAYTGRIETSLQEWRFLITPVASVAAFPVERVMPVHWPGHEWDWLSWAEFMYPFNMSGNPAASVPCGLTRSGLPVGLQIVGRRFDDLGVLRIACAIEALFGRFRAPNCSVTG